MRNRRAKPPDSLARLFLDITGEVPDDASLLRMRRVSTALNLRDNDALWSVLAALEYYARLYEAMPDRVRLAGEGSLDAVRAEARAATEALMMQHRDAIARCKATIELAERMVAEQEARYRTALAVLNEQSLTVMAERAADRVARLAGNRFVGAAAIAAREQRKRLDAAVAAFERVVQETAARAANAEQMMQRRLVRGFYVLLVGGLIAILLAAGAGVLAGSWTACRLRTDCHTMPF